MTLLNQDGYMFIHTFKVSSGKEHKEITKVYYSSVVALENHKLLGGDLLLMKVVHHYK